VFGVIGHLQWVTIEGECLMKTTSLLLIPALVLGTFNSDRVFAAGTSGETAAPGQPFLHPSGDASYSKDMSDDEILAKAKPADNGKVLYISGGVAVSGMRAIDAEEKLYNLKMLFAAGDAYLANVGVHMKDSKGTEVLDTTTRGPVLLVKMPPGSYTVEAKTESGAMITKHVIVGDDHLVSYVMRYPPERQ
jgi:hypothetical protein